MIRSNWRILLNRSQIRTYWNAPRIDIDVRECKSIQLLLNLESVDLQRYLSNRRSQGVRKEGAKRVAEVLVIASEDNIIRDFDDYVPKRTSGKEHFR